MSDRRQSAVAHMVYFTLRESTDETRQALLADCHQYLTDHPGVQHFSTGRRGAEFDRAVNDQQFDVALHLIFENKAAHDAYQTAPRHVEFVERNKATWAQVRIFDSYVE